MSRVQKLNIDRTITEIDNLNQKCLTKRKESDYRETDVRLLIFNLLSNDIQNLLLSITFSKKLKSIEFYKRNGYKIENINEEYMENALYQYVNWISNSYFISIFVQIENYLRIIANHKNINHFKISTTFQNLKNEYNLNNESLNLWKIISNLRNSMHNGGFFNHQDVTIPFKETNYIFTQNESIPYGGIQNFLFFTNELIDILILEINANSKADDYIEHNYANLTFEYEQ